MKTIRLILYAASLFILISCRMQETQKAAEVSKNVVVCFHHYDPKPYKTPSGSFRIGIPKVGYIDSTGTYIDYTPKPELDTLVIPCPDTFSELALSYRNFEYIYYPLLRGDTVIISADSLDYPLLQSKHHPERNQIYNMNYELRKGRTHSGLEAKTCLGGHWVRIAQTIDYMRAQKMDNLLADYCPLDSLHAMFRDYKQAYTDTVQLFKQQQLIPEEIYRRYDYLLRLKEHEAQWMLNKDTTYYRSMEPEISDAYACYPSYQEFMDYYFWFFNYHIKSIKHSHGSYKDWRQTFDEISAKPFQSKSMQMLLQRCIKEIAENFSANDVTKYLDKYVKATGDSILYHNISQQYNLSADANELLLKDLHGNQTSFRQLLEKYKGKVVYVDFWASWCTPCRAEMKPAAELREYYRGKNVAFVYLAYKDEEGAWQKAVRDEGLSEVPDNYLILNAKNSRMLEKIGLSLIPRFILFDKNGNLVEMNAPRPSNENSKKTINKYL